MKPSQICKEAGLSGLTDLSKKSGLTNRALYFMFERDRGQFDTILFKHTHNKTKCPVCGHCRSGE